MRAVEARRVSIPAYLSSQGIQPKTSRMWGRELWYSSPLRVWDSSPSFKVDEVKNLRFDHGLAHWGNAVDLVCELQSVSVSEALRILESVEKHPSLGQGLQIQSASSQRVLWGFSSASSSQSENQTQIFQKKEVKAGLNSGLAVDGMGGTAGEKEKVGFVISSVGKITNMALIYYLQTRKIDLQIARAYLKEITFHPASSKRLYFALGFPCGSQGYEVRNKHFKGFVGSWKTISCLNIEQEGTLTVFEGFLDFLAYLTHRQTEKLQTGVIVLNSTTFRRRALEKIQTSKAKKIYLFLDNDWPWKQVTKFLQNQLAGKVEVVDCSHIYQDHKDFNDFWLTVAEK